MADAKMVEAGGIEPPSESALHLGPTCVALGLITARAPKGRLPLGVPRMIRPFRARGVLEGSAGFDDGGDDRYRLATGLRAMRSP